MHRLSILVCDLQHSDGYCSPSCPLVHLSHRYPQQPLVSSRLFLHANTHITSGQVTGTWWMVSPDTPSKPSQTVLHLRTEFKLFPSEKKKERKKLSLGLKTSPINPNYPEEHFNETCNLRCLSVEQWGEGAIPFSLKFNCRKRVL